MPTNSFTRLDPGSYEAYLGQRYYTVVQEPVRKSTGQSARGRQVWMWRAYCEGSLIGEAPRYREAKAVVLDYERSYPSGRSDEVPVTVGYTPVVGYGDHRGRERG